MYINGFIIGYLIGIFLIIIYAFFKKPNTLEDNKNTILKLANSIRDEFKGINNLLNMYEEETDEEEKDNIINDLRKLIVDIVKGDKWIIFVVRFAE